MPDVGGLKWLFFDVGDTLVDEWEPVDDIIGQFVREACALGYPVKIEAVRELFANCYRKYEQWPMRVAIRTFVEDEGHQKQIQDKLKFQKILNVLFLQRIPFFSSCHGIIVLALLPIRVLERKKDWRATACGSMLMFWRVRLKKECPSQTLSYTLWP